MAEQKLSELYIEVVVKGMQQAQVGLSKIKESVAKADKPVTLKADSSSLQKAANLATADMNKLGKAATEAGEKTKRAMAAGSKAAKEAQKDLDKLGAAAKGLPLQKTVSTPETQKLKLKRSKQDVSDIPLQFAKTDTEKQEAKAELKKLSAPATKEDSAKAGDKGAAELTKKAESAANTMSKLGDAINQVGVYAQRSFLAGGAAIAGFIRAADPVGVEKLAGTVGQIAVQIGSIFLPILDSVKAALDRFLELLRGLSNEQKDQIVQWVKIAGAVALAAVVLPKVIAGFQLLTTVVRAFGVTSAIATGGLTLVLALLAAAVGAFALMGDEGEGGLSGIMAALQPLLDGLKDIGAIILDSLKPVLPLLVDMGKAVVQAMQPLFAIVKEVVELLAGTLAETLASLIPPIKAVAITLIAAFTQLLQFVKPFLAMFLDLFVIAIDTVAAVIEALVPIFEDVFSLIMDALTELQPVFEMVFKAIAFAVMTVAKALIFVARLIKEIASGNLRGAVSSAFQAVEDFQEKIDQRRKDRDERKANKGEGESPIGRHAPTAQQKVELIGIAELWRKAQQSTVESAQQKMETERLRLGQGQLDETKKSNRLLEKIAGDDMPEFATFAA